MGVILKGANGGFRGKAGSVIGSSWKSIDYIKGLYKKSNKPASPEQLEQQTRFRLLMRFLMPLKGFVRVGYGERKVSTHTPMNVAFQENIKRVLSGTYPDLEIDYTQIRIADGYSAGGTEAATVDAGILSVNWDTTLNAMYDQRDDDLIYVMLYHPVSDQFVAPPTPPQRVDGTVDIVLPPQMLSDVGHVWLFSANRKGRNVSRSVYLGTLPMI